MNQRARFRKMCGLTQGHLGRMVGLSAGTICRWERGELELESAIVEGIYRAIDMEFQGQFESLLGAMSKGGVDPILLEMDWHVDVGVTSVT